MAKTIATAVILFTYVCGSAYAIETGSPAADIVDTKRNLERKEQNEKKDQKNWNDFDKMTKPQQQKK